MRRVRRPGQRVGDQAGRDLDFHEDEEHKPSPIQCRFASILRRGDRRMIASITLPLAHAGHSAFSVLALAPILFAAALVAVQSIRGGRRGMEPPP